MLQEIAATIASTLVLKKVVRDIENDIEEQNFPEEGRDLIRQTYGSIGEALFALYDSGHLTAQDNDTGICILANAKTCAVTTFRLKNILAEPADASPEEIEAAKSDQFWLALNAMLSEGGRTKLASFVITLRLGTEILQKWLDANTSEAVRGNRPVLIACCNSGFESDEIEQKVFARMLSSEEGPLNLDVEVHTCGVFELVSIPNHIPEMRAFDRDTGEDVTDEVREKAPTVN